MGFKLIRDKTKDEHQVLEKLRDESLEFEAKRWSNITNNSEKKEDFVERFKLVKSKRQKKEDPEELVKALSNSIKKERKSLAQTQGNIDIEKLQELLS